MTIKTRFLPLALLAGALAASAASASFGSGGGTPSRHPQHKNAPARAGKATQVPEPADAALFGLGIAGVAIGRRFRRRGG